MRKFAVWVHRYLGLALGGLLLVSAVTGSIIVFSKPLDARLNPGLLRVEPQSGLASLDAVLDEVRRAVPGKQVAFFFMPQAPGLAMEVWFRGDSLRAYADPHTGELLGMREATGSLMGFLVDLHIHLLSGETGEQIAGWAGVGAIVLSIFGLWLWWPRKGKWTQAFRIKRGAAPIRVWRDIHKLAGVIAFGFILLTVTTGTALALYDVITERALVALTGEGTRKPAPRSGAAAGPRAPLSPMLAQAASVFPDGQLTRVGLPAKPDGAVMVRMRQDGEIHQFGRTFLWFDQYDGSLLRVDNALHANLATRIQTWLYPLHTGVYGGLATRWLQVLVGLSLALLTLSGAWLWWKGHRARRAAVQVRRTARVQETDGRTV